MLVTSIFSFSHNIIKGFFLQVIKSQECLIRANILNKMSNEGDGRKSQLFFTHSHKMTPFDASGKEAF